MPRMPPSIMSSSFTFITPGHLLSKSMSNKASSILQAFVHHHRTPRHLPSSPLRSRLYSTPTKPRRPSSSSTDPLPRNPATTPNRQASALPATAAAASAATILAISSMAAAYSITVTKTNKAAVPDDAALKPHHITNRHGKTTGFKNPHPSAGTGHSGPAMMASIIKTKWAGEMPSPSTANHHIPSVTPTFLPTRDNSSAPVLVTDTSSSSTSSSSTSSSNADGAEPKTPPSPAPGTAGALRATWLGHACYYVEFPSGLRVLFDPVFEACCSPPPFSWLGFPKRFTPPPASISQLPFVDAVVISHSHYDHLSLPSVRDIAARHPKAHFFVGLGLEKWFRSAGLKNVTELDWWEDAELKLSVAKDNAGESETAKLEIQATLSCLPCQHTSARGPFDRDTTLWCSWAVSSGAKSVWFGGDTGYRAVPHLPASEDDWSDKYASTLPRNPDFAKIGQLRGPFDLGLVPIGAYKPRHLFSHMHANPRDAVEIFKDTRCRKAVGIHWATWVLTSEEVEEPPRLLREALRKSGIEEEGVFGVVALGESREF